MWYFSWILGLGLACSFAIFNAMWFELRNDVLVQARANAKKVTNHTSSSSHGEQKI